MFQKFNANVSGSEHDNCLWVKNNATKSWYLFDESNALKYQNAIRYCNETGGAPVSISSMVEYRWLKKMLSK